MTGRPTDPAPARAAIVVVGSLNLDLVVRTPRAPGPGETITGSALARHAGGKGANQAAAAARLVDRATSAATPTVVSTLVSMIGRVGDDADGVFLVEALRACGVDVSAIGRDESSPTGIAAITVDESTGENRIVLIAGANAALSPGVLGQHHDVLTAADVILLQLEIPLPTVQTAARMGREKRAIVILDPAPARRLPEAFLRLCDFVTPNQHELAQLTGQRPNADATASFDEIAAAARALLRQGARNVVVKLGARGVLLVTPTEQHHVPAFPVSAVDTTAAGDAWNGALAVALCAGQPLRAAARFACAAAALTVTRPGALPSLPTRDEVLALLARSA